MICNSLSITLLCTVHDEIATYLYGLSNDINCNITWECITGLSVTNTEKLIIYTYFLNQDISVNISQKYLTSGVHIGTTHMERTRSQIFHLGLTSFFFMK